MTEVCHKAKILFCVLDWGLGHATRSIPIINHLKKSGYHIDIASSGSAKTLLEKEFKRKIIELPAYNIRYSSNSTFFILQLSLQIPRIYSTIKAEQLFIESLDKQNNYNIVISDSRFGCFLKHKKSIFISHQLNIQGPNQVATALGSYLNRKKIKAFDEIWIPDSPGNQLSGLLSKSNVFQNQFFIGPLSRLNALDSNINQYEFLFLISGPEPHRTMFEEYAISLAQRSTKRIAIVAGNDKKSWSKENITYYGLATTTQLNQLISSSKLIISRSGYTTIMDLVQMKKPALFIPTPGQTEQEYLAKHIECDQFKFLNNLQDLDLDKIKMPESFNLDSGILNLQTDLKLIDHRIEYNINLQV